MASGSALKRAINSARPSCSRNTHKTGYPFDAEIIARGLVFALKPALMRLRSITEGIIQKVTP